ncbi:DUF4442 domain-containing protein [Myxococcota bacterium]|nr:DUF4442 domain-containing protein [Myxococcota bacterium]
MAFGLRKIPMIAFAAPVVEELDDERCVIRIPLNRRTRNHLNSMYLGTLTVGADLACGLLADAKIRRANRKISLVFKDMKAEFLKRPDGDVRFVCEEGDKIGKELDITEATGERRNIPSTILAKVGDEVVARFVLTLSVKKI